MFLSDSILIIYTRKKIDYTSTIINLAKCIITQLKTNIKIHLRYIYRCNSFSVFAEEEVVINEDKFVVIMDEYDDGA